MICPNCAEDAPDDAKWCEACGQDLNAEPLPECVSCGEREVGEDGYCGSCGWKQPEERDHIVFVDGPVAAVTDRGKRHRHNEDSVAVGVADDGRVVLVVCDGVSSTPGSAEASLRAATTARDLLVAGLADEVLDAPTLLSKATEAAQAEASMSPEVESSAPYSQGGPPSSTFVAVVASPSPTGVDLSTAWVGDSRAYWLGPEPERLTEDHEIGGGLIRWLGADSADPTPEIRTTSHDGEGHVVVCSDGLWRYAAEADEMRSLVNRLVGDGSLGADLASELVTFANDSGGHDNISVALWANDPALQPADSPVPPQDPTGQDQPETPPDRDPDPAAEDPENPDRHMTQNNTESTAEEKEAQ